MPEAFTYDQAMRKAITYAHRASADVAVEVGKAQDSTALVLAQLARYAQASVAWTAIASEIRTRSAATPAPRETRTPIIDAAVRLSRERGAAG